MNYKRLVKVIDAEGAKAGKDTYERASSGSNLAEIGSTPLSIRDFFKNLPTLWRNLKGY